jgi:signal transduction histidine kinase
MSYVALHGSFDSGTAAGDERLRRRVERYRRALRRCAQRSRREKELRAAAEAAGVEKTRAMAAVCHDLRTPLNAILAWTQLAGTAPAGHDLRKALSRIESNARSQAMLINDILDLVNSANGTLRIVRIPVDLSKVVAAALAVVEPAAASKRLRIEWRPPTGVTALVLGDPVRLVRVVWNLLTNAVKFSPSGGRVTLDLRAEGDTATLRVSDTGYGIPPNLLPQVFERYQQADADGGGLGLGLTIVRRLVEAHGGSVTALSAGQGWGATFIVTLPLLREGAKSELLGVGGATVRL